MYMFVLICTLLKKKVFTFESVHKAQTSDHFSPLPNADGGGRGRRGLSVHRRS